MLKERIYNYYFFYLGELLIAGIPTDGQYYGARLHKHKECFDKVIKYKVKSELRININEDYENN